MNLLPFTFRGSQVDVFFDIDWKTHKVTNLDVTDGGLSPRAQRIWLSDEDRAVLVDAIIAEVALSTIEVAAAKKAGLVANA
jgi:hypothetical protein